LNFYENLVWFRRKINNMHKDSLKLGLLFQELTKEVKDEHTEAQEES